MSAAIEVDFLAMNDLLGEEEQMVRASVQRFVRDRIMPTIQENYEKGEFPPELVQELGSLGCFGVNLHGYGCPGMSELAYGVASQELEVGDAGLRSVVSVQSSLVMYPIHAFGSEEQKERWLPPMAAGTKVGCFGLTEPDFGSNPGGLRTKAVKTDKGYVLNGAKMWITNGTMADVAIVWAKLDGVIRGFLVERGTPGFQQITMKNKMSFRASDTAELILEDCEIPAENLMPGTRGLRSPLSCLTQARFGVAWGALGAAMACFVSARDYAIERKQFNDKPIAAHQITQDKLARMLTEITKAQCLSFRVTELKQQKKVTASQVSMLKMNNTVMALDVARSARGILGANGISGEYPIMRHMCNLETTITYEGTEDIHKLILGREITGIPAFS